jgi:hypothetical protein
MNKRNTLLFGISLLAVVALACGSSTATTTVKTATPAQAASSSDTSATQAPADTQAAATDAPTAAPAPAAKLGDTVEQGGFSITATSVDDPCKAGILYKAKDGKRIIGVNVILANVSSDKKLSINPLYATLIDSEGFTYKAELAGCETQIDTVDLAKGEKVRGVIPFEVPTDAKLASIKYATSLIGGDTLQAGLTK